MQSAAALPQNLTLFSSIGNMRDAIFYECFKHESYF